MRLSKKWFVIFTLLVFSISCGGGGGGGGGNSSDSPNLPPTSLVATPQQGGVTLNWINNSQSAKFIEVYRTPCHDTGTEVLSPFIIATLPATATSYSDSNLNFDAYNYWLVARIAEGQTGAESEHIKATVEANPGIFSLTGSISHLPWGRCKRAHDKNWCVDQGQWTDDTTNLEKAIDAYHPVITSYLFPVYRNLVYPNFNVDPADNPSLLFGAPMANGDHGIFYLHINPLMRWENLKLEPSDTNLSSLIPPVCDSMPLVYASDNSMRTVVAVVPDPINDPYHWSFYFMDNKGGTWNTHLLESCINGHFYNPILSMGNNDMALMVVANNGPSGEYILWLEQSSNIWSQSTIPMSSDLNSTAINALFQRPDGAIEVYYETIDLTATNVNTLWQLEYNNGSWSAPVRIMDSIGYNAPSNYFYVTPSPAKDRVLVAAFPQGRLTIKVRDNQGWRTQDLGDYSRVNAVYGYYSQGFGSDGKFYINAQLSNDDSPPTIYDYAYFQER